MFRAIASVAAAALAGAASLANPLDSIARGKLVRHFQTRKAEMAATVCLPATTAAERMLIKAPCAPTAGSFPFA